MRKTKMIGVSLIVISAVSLLGCNESSPSESTVEKQVKQHYASCGLMTVHDFKKVNGFLQQDGSYVVPVKYTLKLRPSEKASQLVDEYKSKRAELDARVAENKAILEDLTPQIKTRFDDRTAKCGSTRGDNKTGNPECEDAKKTLDDFAAENHWQERFNERPALANQVLTLSMSYRDKIEEAFNHDCKLIAFGGVLGGYFHANKDILENYQKEFTSNAEVDVTLIESDNGWVIK